MRAELLVLPHAAAPRRLVARSVAWPASPSSALRDLLVAVEAQVGRGWLEAMSLSLQSDILEGHGVSNEHPLRRDSP